MIYSADFWLWIGCQRNLRRNHEDPEEYVKEQWKKLFRASDFPWSSVEMCAANMWPYFVLSSFSLSLSGSWRRLNQSWTSIKTPNSLEQKRRVSNVLEIEHCKQKCRFLAISFQKSPSVTRSPWQNGLIYRNTKAEIVCKDDSFAKRWKPCENHIMSDRENSVHCT